MCNMTDEEIFRKVNEIENKLSALYQDPDADEDEIFKLQDEMNILLRSTEERWKAIHDSEEYIEAVAAAESTKEGTEHGH